MFKPALKINKTNFLFFRTPGGRWLSIPMKLRCLFRVGIEVMLVVRFEQRLIVSLTALLSARVRAC